MAIWALLAALALVYAPLASAKAMDPGGFVSLTPYRLLDTRSGIGVARAGAVAAGAAVHLKVAGRGGVPASGVSAVVLNVTVTAPTAPGWIAAYPGYTAFPNVSNLNFVAGQTVPNLVAAQLNTSGVVDLLNGSSGSVQLIADVAGYFVAGTARDAGAFTPIIPYRLLDTRYGNGSARAAVPAGGSVHLQVTGRGGIPSGISAVVLNVTATGPVKPGWIAAYADGTAFPGVSNLNFVAGQTVPNLVVAPVGANGKVNLLNGSDGSVNLVADASGYFLAGNPVWEGMFGAVNPYRLLDTRVGTGAARAAVPAGGVVGVQVAGRAGVPAPGSPAGGVAAAVLNVTVTSPTRSGYITAFAGGSLPSASNLNFIAGQTVPNLVFAPVSASGVVYLYNGSPGTVQLIADVSGYVRSVEVATDPVTAPGAVPGVTTVDLSWVNPNSQTFAGVNIRRALGPVPPSSPTSGTSVVNMFGGTASFTDTSLAPDTQYSYAIFASNYTPVYAAPATVTTTTLPLPVPAPIAGPHATPGVTTLDLAWTNPPDQYYTGVVIRRALGPSPPTDPNSGTQVADVPAPANGFTDTALTPGTQYSYSFFAHNAAHVLAPPTLLTTTTLSRPVPPPVTGARVVSSTTTSIALVWTEASDPYFTGVMIRRNLGPIPPSSPTSGFPVADVPAGVGGFTDGGLTPGTQYSYAFFAHNATPAYAAPAFLSTGTIPGPVTGVHATPGPKQVVLSWVNPPGGSFVGTMIRRALGTTPPSSPTSGTLVADVPAPANGFTDTALTPLTTYSYALFAHDATPAYAPAASVTTATTAWLGAISGAVTDASSAHNPLAGVVVTVTTPGTQGTPASAVTSSSGTYQVSALEPASDYQVCLAAPASVTGGATDASGYVSQCYSGIPAGGTPTPVTVTPGATTAGIDAALATGAAISGTVTDAAPAHAPLAGVRVSVHVPGLMGPAGTAVTSSAGTYQVKGLSSAADSQVCFDGAGATGGSSDATGYVYQCYSGVPEGGSPTPVATLPGQVTSGISASLAPGGAISGVVTDAAPAHGPLAGVDVSVHIPALMGPGHSTLTAADGTYRVSGLPAGSTYTVCFSATYRVDQCYDAAPPWVAPTTLSVTAGDVTSGINAALVLGGVVTGRVTDAADPHQPLENVGVQVSTNSEGSEGVPSYDAWTSSDGTYSLVVPPGSAYWVCFHASGASGGSGADPGYIDQCYSGQTALGGGDPVVVVAGQTTSGIDAAMVPGGAIAGKVTQAGTDAPLEMVHVSVAPASDPTHDAFGTTTLTDGTYNLRATPGAYRVCFDGAGATGGSSDGSGYVPQCYDNVPLGGAATPVTITAVGATTHGIDAALFGRAPGSFTGHVTDASAHALAGVQVSVDPAAPVTTDSTGAYTVSGLPPGGDYTVCFAASSSTTGGSSDATGYATQCLPGRRVASGTATTLDASLASGGAVSGVVTDAAGSHHALAGVGVQVTFPGQMGPAADAVTASDGTYKVVGLDTRSDYQVCFNSSASVTGGSSEATGYAPQCYDGVAHGGSPTPVTVTVGALTSGVGAAMSAGGAISGAVTDATSHASLAGVQVSVHAPGWMGPLQVVSTGPAGTYTAKGMASGSQYSVCFTAYSGVSGGTSDSTGYVSQCYDNLPQWEAPPWGSTTPVTVAVGATTSGVNAALTPGGVVSGRVTQAGTALGLHNVGVQVSTSPDPGGDTYNAWTNPDGSYSVVVPPFGSYRVCFHASGATGGTSDSPGYLDQCYPAQTALGGGDPVAVTAGHTTSGVDEAMVPGGAITGTVTQEGTGAPLESVKVAVSPPSDPTHDVFGTRTGPDGTYILVVAPGTYRVCFDPSGATGGSSDGPGYVGQCYDNVPLGGAPTPVTVTSVGQTVTGIDAVLPPLVHTYALAASGYDSLDQLGNWTTTNRPPLVRTKLRTSL